MHMYRLEGTHHAIGAEYGALLKASRFRIPPTNVEKLKYALACEAIVRDHAPELVEELEGVIEGSGYDARKVKSSAWALDHDPRCSVIAVSGAHTADGKPLFGRNFDWFFPALNHIAFCQTVPEGALASLGCNDLLVGRHDGLNAAGVAIAITGIWGIPDRPGVMFPVAARMVLDRCRSTAEAVALLEGIPHARTTNFLIADASGAIVQVEAAPGKVCATWAERGFAAVTNQFVSKTMASYERVRKRPRDSYSRLCTLREWVAARQGPLSAADMQAVLSTPPPRGVCVRNPGKARKFGTIWSWMARLGTGSLDLADGLPSETPYRPFTV